MSLATADVRAEDSGVASAAVTTAQAGLEAYSTAYWWSAAFFVAGLVASALLYRPGLPTTDPDPAPVVHM